MDSRHGSCSKIRENAAYAQAFSVAFDPAISKHFEPKFLHGLRQRSVKRGYSIKDRSESGCEIPIIRRVAMTVGQGIGFVAVQGHRSRIGASSIGQSLSASKSTRMPAQS